MNTTVDMNEEPRAVSIERGIIREYKSDAQAGRVYKVESCTRGGVKSRWMEAVNAYVKEYTGEPPARDKYAYGTGDLVNYFMFPDGRGMIIGKVRKDL